MVIFLEAQVSSPIVLSRISNRHPVLFRSGVLLRLLTIDII